MNRFVITLEVRLRLSAERGDYPDEVYVDYAEPLRDVIASQLPPGKGQVEIKQVYREES